MRVLNLTDLQFEHTLGILGEIDLSPLLTAFSGGGRMIDLIAALPLIGQAREKHLFRRLEAVWSATHEELARADTSPDAMAMLELRAASVPIKTTLEGLGSFFDGLGLFPSATPGSSVQLALEMMKGQKEQALRRDDPPSPSVNSSLQLLEAGMPPDVSQ